MPRIKIFNFSHPYFDTRRRGDPYTKVLCLKCGAWISKGVFDQDGEPFKAYFCNAEEAEAYCADDS